jgi:hypothetical protein
MDKLTLILFKNEAADIANGNCTTELLRHCVVRFLHIKDTANFDWEVHVAIYLCFEIRNSEQNKVLI